MRELKSLALELWILVRWLLLKAWAWLAFSFFGRKAWVSRGVINLGNALFRRPYPTSLFLSYDSYVQKYGASLQEYSALLPLSEWLNDRVVLDLGAGLCQYSTLLLEGGARRVLAVECQSEKLDWAKAHYPKSDRLALLCASASSLPVEDSSVDTIFSHTVFEHLDDVPGALRSLHRILKPEGLVLLSYNYIHHRGGHHLFPYIHFPWPLWIADEASLCRYWSDRLAEDQARGAMGFFPKGCRIESLSEGNEIHLNRLNFEQFETMVWHAGFAMVQRKTSEQVGRTWPWLLRRTPVKFFLSGTIYYVLKKGAAVCAQ